MEKLIYAGIVVCALGAGWGIYDRWKAQQMLYRECLETYPTKPAFCRELSRAAWGGAP